MAVRISTPSYNKATTLLKNGQLREACCFLCSVHHILPATHQISDESELLLADLDRILNFFAQDGNDPKREELYCRLNDRIWTLCEQLYDVESPNQLPQNEKGVTASLEVLLNNVVDDYQLNEVFEQIAESRWLTREDRDSLNLALFDDAVPEYIRATLLSATTLHLIQWFDAELTESLYAYTFDDQPVMLRMQAWVALILVAFIHKERISNLPRLREQYKLMCETESDLLYDIQVALLQCREAQTANQRVHAIVEKFDEEDEQETMNANLKELFAFISEGFDMSINIFKKQAKLPFFSLPGSRHHWLEPFSLEQPQMKSMFEANPQALPWVKMMMQSVAQCETDKYATVLTMHSLGDGMLMNAIGEKLEKTGLKFEEVMPVPPLFVMRNYLHDLYRYCLLHPRAKEMRHQPFDIDLKMCMNPWLCNVTQDPKRLEKIGDLLLGKEHWGEAAQVYELIAEKDPSESSLQRLSFAYCKLSESTGNFSIAIRSLRRCNKLFPGNKWTLKLLADTLHSDSDYACEEDILNEALLLDSEDTSFLIRKGRCLNAQMRFKEALDPLFKADLLKEGKLQVQRELSLALFGINDFARALRYSNLAISHERIKEADLVMHGHLLLQRRDIHKALEQYKKAGIEVSKNALLHDRKLLRNALIDDITIDLMYELLGKPSEQ